MRYFLIFVLTVCFESILFSQNETINTVLPTDTILGLVNGNAHSIDLLYCDSSINKNCFGVTILNKKIDGISSGTEGNEMRLYFDKKGRVRYQVQFKNDKVDGPFIVFNKKGAVVLIVKYENSKLVGLIYSSNQRVFDIFLKECGIEAPVSYSRETKIFNID
jgi:uncharacterized protein YkuJ